MSNGNARWRSAAEQIIPRLAAIGLLLLAWWATVATGVFSSNVLPSPGAVLQAFIDSFATPDPPRESIKGAVWLPNTGYDALDDATQGYFFASLALLTKGDKDAPLVFFCMRDCWMYWNAGKRAIDSGYGRVFWYPGGSDGWAAAHWPTERIHPFQP